MRYRMGSVICASRIRQGQKIRKKNQRNQTFFFLLFELFPRLFESEPGGPRRVRRSFQAEVSGRIPRAQI